MLFLNLGLFSFENSESDAKSRPSPFFCINVMVPNFNEPFWQKVDLRDFARQKLVNFWAFESSTISIDPPTEAPGEPSRRPAKRQNNFGNLFIVFFLKSRLSVFFLPSNECWAIPLHDTDTRKKVIFFLQSPNQANQSLIWRWIHIQTNCQTMGWYCEPGSHSVYQVVWGLELTKQSAEFADT